MLTLRPATPQHQRPPSPRRISLALLKTAHISLKPDEKITFFYEKRKEKKQKNKTKTLLSEKGYVKRLNYFFLLNGW